MGILNKIKNYFDKKKKLKSLNTVEIPNSNLYVSTHKTIVFISGAMPTHDKDSGSNRLKEIILAYKSLNYNCILVVENVFEDDKYVQFYKNLGITIYVESNLFSNYINYLKSINNINYIWFYGPNTLKKYINKLTSVFPNAKSIFDMVDIHFLRIERALELQPQKISLKKRYQKYFNIETKLAQKVDIVVAISEVEKQFMSSYILESKIVTISNVHYAKIGKEDIVKFEDRKDLLFIGSTHTPNIDAIYYLYEEIMPLVWKILPNVKLQIIGNVKDSITDIIHNNIEFLGFIEDVTPYFLNSKLMVAPLRYGAGVKGKLGQAFEFYLPVVTTSIGAEGMFLENNIHAFITNDTEEFAKNIISLYQDKKTWQTFSQNSTLSLQPFSVEKLKDTISKL